MKTSTLTVLSVFLGVGIGVGTAYLRTAVLWPSRNLPSAQGTVSPTAAAPVAVGPTPKVELAESRTYDFGVLEAEATGQHVFQIRNAGSAPLEIQQGGSTCKCTVSRLGNDAEGASDGDKRLTLPPGGTTEATIEWKTKGFVGKFTQTAYFRTNDPEQANLALTVQGQVLDPYVAQPHEVVFSGISTGETAEAEVQVLGFRHLPFEKPTVTLTDTTTASFFDVSDEPLAEAEVKKDPQAFNGRRLHVRVKPGLPLGAFHQRIIVRPGEDKDGPTVEIPVSGKIIGDLTVMGARWNENRQSVTLGVVRQDAGAETTVQIIARGPQRGDVQLEVETVRPDFLEVRLGKAVELSGGQVTQIPLTIRVPKGIRFGNYMGPSEAELGQIVLKTHLPNAPQLRLWVGFAVVN